MTDAWLARHVALIAQAPLPETPLITAGDLRPMLDGLDAWDMWPLALHDGSPAPIAGGELWMYLAAPWDEDPNLRHDRARIRLLHLQHGVWRDLGDVLPDGFSPGTREWSGSAVLEPRTGAVRLFYTATGRAEAGSAHFEQRLFETRGQLRVCGDRISLTDWTVPVELVRPDGDIYVDTATAVTEPGMIKGFRDPGYVRDPDTGVEYILFSANLAASDQRYNGAVGLAQADPRSASGWTLKAPLVSADGVNNELERAHIIRHGELYYLFWSTQTVQFDPAGPQGPVGLYGMAAPSILGPYEPLNGSGLVLCNPAAVPAQAYCWWVTPDLRVVSFVDRWKASDPLDTRGFGGVAAPDLYLKLDGYRAELARVPAMAG